MRWTVREGEKPSSTFDVDLDEEPIVGEPLHVSLVGVAYTVIAVIPGENLIEVVRIAGPPQPSDEPG